MPYVKLCFDVLAKKGGMGKVVGQRAIWAVCNDTSSFTCSAAEREIKQHSLNSTFALKRMPGDK